MQFVVSQFTESLIWWVHPVTCPVTSVVGGIVKGQHVVVSFPHFSHPGAFFLHVLENVSFLVIGYSLERHNNFFRFGGCLKAAMGASANIGFSSGFLKIMDLKCLLSTGLILGRNGLKLNGAIILPVCLSS